MAKNKGRSKIQDDEVIDQDETSTEGQGSSGKTASNTNTAAPQSFTEKYRNLLLIGGVGVLAIVGYFVYQWTQRDKVNAEADAAMMGAVLYYEQDSMQKAINGDAQFEGLISIVDDYGSSDAGNMARYYLGTALLKTKDIDGGIEALEEFKQNSSMVSAAAHGALGYAYEQKGEFEKAAESYKTASATPEENDYSTPFYLMHAARNLESANKADEALETYKSIREKFPKSEAATTGTVDRYIAKLSPDDFE